MLISRGSPLALRLAQAIQAGEAKGSSSFLGAALALAATALSADAHVRPFSSRTDASATNHSPPSTSGSSPAATAAAAPPKGWLRGPQERRKAPLQDDEWTEVIDPATQERRWRSRITGEMTASGVPRPPTWHEVVDKKTGLLYYWCPATNETTGVGEARPGPYGRHASYTAPPVAPPLTSEVQSPATSSATGAAGGRGSASKADADSAAAEKQRKKGEEDPLIWAVYNNPLGWMLIGMAGWGIIMQNIK